MDFGNRSSAGIVIIGGQVLLPGEGLRPMDVVCAGDEIIDLRNKAQTRGMQSLDARGCLVLPGIVDIHGDAFKRQIMPRPKTIFPMDIATLETDRQLAANGITTAYHGITVSWEPGLRGIEMAKGIVSSLETCAARLLVDNRLHIRWETYAVDEVPDVIAILGAANKPVLAFNDHTTPALDAPRRESKLKGWADRAMIGMDDYATLLDARRERAGEVQTAISVMAGIVAARDIAMLSHDDGSVECRDHYRRLGIGIAEFPLNWATAESSARSGDMVVLGAPNVVRGGSHNGAISAEEAIARGICTILATDYYYPAPLNAAFKLVASGILSMEAAWKLVSDAPARAAGLTDRGRIAIGARADLVVVPVDATRPVATIAGGRLAYMAA